MPSSLSIQYRFPLAFHKHLVANTSNHSCAITALDPPAQLVLPTLALVKRLTLSMVPLQSLELKSGRVLRKLPECHDQSQTF